MMVQSSWPRMYVHSLGWGGHSLLLGSSGHVSWLSVCPSLNRLGIPSGLFALSFCEPTRRGRVTLISTNRLIQAGKGE